LPNSWQDNFFILSTATIFSPYRICPIGAHIDHQGGEIEMRAALDEMIRGGFKAVGILQSAPEEWRPPLL
jgi:hypothetical protein